MIYEFGIKELWTATVLFYLFILQAFFPAKDKKRPASLPVINIIANKISVFLQKSLVAFL
jgi:hypothetical protein